MEKKTTLNKISYLLLLGLLIFLPFSSWVVSLTGKPILSLLRDLLVLSILILNLISFRSLKYRFVLISSLLLILWGLCSFFWREDSFVQWVRGFRNLFGPILLLIALLISGYEREQKKKILEVSLVVGLVVTVLSIIELSGVKIPLTSVYSGQGALILDHKIGGLSLGRIQSVMAGPNALGLYLLSSVGIVITLRDYLKKNAIAIIVLFSFALISTFSRSSLLGLMIALIEVFYFWAKEKIGRLKTIALLITTITIACLIMVSLLKSDKNFHFLFTHNDSSILRIQQYERIHGQYKTIGIKGRGLGAAGPSSQNRIDGGPNYWTENTYLDIFEEIGIFGLILYISIILGSAIALCKKYKQEKNSLFLGAIAILVAFSIVGNFINFYTGQAGLYLLVLLVGLALAETKRLKKDKIDWK
jgi:O-antigen ligase